MSGGGPASQQGPARPRLPLLDGIHGHQVLVEGPLLQDQHPVRSDVQHPEGDRQLPFRRRRRLRFGAGAFRLLGGSCVNRWLDRSQKSWQRSASFRPSNNLPKPHATNAYDLLNHFEVPKGIVLP
jgi:hypothetical protein